MDEITINLRALTEDSRKEIYHILIKEGKIIEDEINYQATIDIDLFEE